MNLLNKGLGILVAILGVFGLAQKRRADKNESDLEQDEHEDVKRSYKASVEMSKNQSKKIEAVKARDIPDSDIRDHFFDN